MTEKFKQLGIQEQTLEAIKILGFTEPSEIQEKTIPLVLAGKDVIAGASTGSGKTLAFGAGIIHNSKPDYGIQGLILTPTRELAEQITRELRKFMGKKKLHALPIYGGVSMHKQIEELRRTEIVVGTPGRILDHLSRRTLDLQHVNTLVLDEADRMFDMGFKDDVEKIISQCPKKRQTLLYSATISQDIARLSSKHMDNPVEVSAEVHVDPTKLSQIYYDIGDGLKFSLLKYLLENEKSKLVMVFCNTRGNVDFVANNLKAMGIEALPIHGGYTQDKRNKIMEIFHSNKVNVLVCTDVAARGLDIKNVSHIYNYDIPREAKEYVHRIGRTARAGEEGIVINIVTSRDYENFSEVLKHYPEFKINIEETPQIPRVMLRWMNDKRRSFGDRGSGNRDSRGSGRYGNRDSRSSSGGRGDRRSSGGRRDSRSGGSYGRSSSGGRSYSRDDRNSGPRRDSRSSGSYGRSSSGSSSNSSRRPSSGGRSYGGSSSNGRRSDSRSSSSRGPRRDSRR